MSSPPRKMDTIKQGFQKLQDSHDEAPHPYEILPCEINFLTPALMEEAETKLNETPAVREKALAKMRKFIEGEKNLKTPTDDLFLLAFLRARKFKVKKAFKLLQDFWAFRKEHRMIYDTIDIKTVKEVILRSFIGFLWSRDRNGSMVLVCKVGSWDPEKDTYEDLFRAVTALLLYSLNFPASHIAGFRVILDMRALSWTQLKFVTPANVLLLIRSTQFCFPARYKGIHILTESKLFNFIWTLAYPLLTSKLKKRITFHGDDFESLLECIHPSVLPEEFGGQAAQFNNDKWVEIVENNTDKIMGLLNYGYMDKKEDKK